MQLVQLTRGYVALVDDEDFERVRQSKWHVAVTPSGHIYARRVVKLQSGRWGDELLHRFLMCTAPDQLVDHRNGDGLDNRRENLRIATHEQNSRNRNRTPAKSGIRGVFFDKTRRVRPWRAYLDQKPKRKHLGWFDTKDEAVAARRVAAAELHGEFAGAA